MTPYRKDSAGRIEIDGSNPAECLLANAIERNGDYRIEVIECDNCKRIFLVKNEVNNVF